MSTSTDQRRPASPPDARAVLSTMREVSGKVPRSGDLEPGAVPTRVIRVDPQTDSRWEAFVTAHPAALIYHHPRWLQVIGKVYSDEPVAFASEDVNGQLRGILPLFYTRGLLRGRRLSSLPHTPVAGPLAYNNRCTAALIRAAVEWVQRRPGSCLQLRVPRPELAGLVDGVAVLPWEETYSLELPEHPEELHFGNSRNHARIRWAINKGAKLGVRVRLAETEEELRLWYEIHLDTMRSHASPPRPYRFFKVAWELLRPCGLMRLLLAEQHENGQSRLLAGSIFLMFGQTVFYAYNGRRRGELSLRPNEVIQWQAIHDACRDGFRHYDFGQVTESNRGLAEFKAKWGAEPRRLYRCYYPAPRELETGALRANSFARRFANTLWQRLPLHATAALGDWLHSYL